MQTETVDASASTQRTRPLTQPSHPTDQARESSSAVISPGLLGAVTEGTPPQSPRRSVQEAAVVDIRMDDASRLARHAEAYRTEKFELPNPDRAPAFLRRMAEHPTLTGDVKEQNTQRAKDEVFGMHGSSRTQADPLTKRTGQLKNFANWSVDLLAISASLINTIMRRAHPEEFRSVQPAPGQQPQVNEYAVKTAQIFITLQFTLQFICAIYAGRQLWRTIARQAPERPFVPAGMTDTAAKLESQAAEYKTAGNALRAEMRRGTVGEALTPFIEEVEAKRAPLDNTLTINKNKYISQGPENFAKATRQLIVTAFLTASIVKGNAHNAIGFVGQVVAMLYSWAAHYLVFGPAQESLLEHLGLDNKLNRTGPQIARNAAERAMGGPVGDDAKAMAKVFNETYRPDPETEAELLQLLKGPNQIRAQCAAPFFADDQAQAQREFAEHVGMTPTQIARRDTLLQKDVRANLPAPTSGAGDGDGMEIQEISTTRPAGTHGPLPGKPLKAEERTELDALNQMLEKQIAALPPDKSGETARLRTNLEQVAADIEHFENGTWEQMQPARRRVALAAAEGNVQALAKMVGDRVGSTFVEAAPNIVQRIASTYNCLILNSASLISWSAIRQLQAAKGQPIDTKTAIAVTWVLYVGYVAGTVFGGANATQGKLINRGNWVNEYRHAPPALGQKAWMLMKASFIGIMGMPLEIKRLSSIQYSIRTANKLLAEGKGKQRQTAPAEQTV